MKKHPNILFLMSDEHRADVTGYAGNPVIRTPNLDRLANEGAVFTNAYTPSPICVPMRQCMMAGQYPNTCDCKSSADDLAPGYNTFSKWFTTYGYNTVVCGKLHHHGWDQMQGWTQRIGMETHVDRRKVHRREGYETLRIPEGTGKWSDTKEIQRAVAGESHCQIDDAYSLDGALKFIRNYFVDPMFDRPMPEHPLMLKVSFKRPHYPYATPEDKLVYYMNRVKPYVEKETFDHPFLSSHQVIPGEDVSEWEIRRATAAYYGMIEEIDEDYGKIMSALEEVGQNLDDWIIVFTSDHGEMLGEHGIWEKQKFFEASVKVPMIIRYPKKIQPIQVRENINSIDLYATLCDLAGLEEPEGLDSRSMVRLMTGDGGDWDNVTYSYFVLEGRETLMIKMDHLKYQHYGEGMDEVLFDLERDPDEKENFINDMAYKKQIEIFREKKDMYYRRR